MGRLLLIVAILACALLSHLPASDAATNTLNWSYSGSNGPKYWGNTYKQCNSAHQSPIDIISKKAIYDKYLKPFTFSYTTKSDYEIYNGGANIVITFGTTDWVAKFSGSAAEAFKPASMHFHWGLTDNTGSEHHMDGVTYALEGHIVMYNSRDYTNFSEAVKNVNGLAVMGVFFEHDDSGTPNPTLEAIATALKHPILQQCNCTTKTAANTANLTFFQLDSIFPTNKRFFRYKGSLTTPPCTENVLWSLYYDRMKVTTNQLKAFRAIKYPKESDGTSKYMAGNHRPVLALNPPSPLNAPRYVASSFAVIGAASSFVPSSLAVLLLAAFGVLFR